MAGVQSAHRRHKTNRTAGASNGGQGAPQLFDGLNGLDLHLRVSLAAGVETWRSSAGNLPWRTSSAYALAAATINSPRSAYCLANGGTDSTFKPKAS